jgi:hypothetical protein
MVLSYHRFVNAQIKEKDAQIAKLLYMLSKK